MYFNQTPAPYSLNRRKTPRIPCGHPQSQKKPKETHFLSKLYRAGPQGGVHAAMPQATFFMESVPE